MSAGEWIAFAALFVTIVGGMVGATWQLSSRIADLKADIRLLKAEISSFTARLRVVEQGLASLRGQSLRLISQGGVTAPDYGDL